MPRSVARDAGPLGARGFPPTRAEKTESRLHCLFGRQITWFMTVSHLDVITIHSDAIDLFVQLLAELLLFIIIIVPARQCAVFSNSRPQRVEIAVHFVL